LNSFCSPLTETIGGSKIASKQDEARSDDSHIN
jgi:hypothetical protein